MIKQLILCLALCCNGWAAFRACGTATSGTKTTLSLAAGSPAGLAANDTIVLVTSIDDSSQTITWPSGFTQLYNTGIALPDGEVLGAAWKLAVGGDSLTTTKGAGNGGWVVQACAWSGRDTGNPPVGSTIATSTASNASPTTVTANGVTALAGDDLFWVGGLDVTAATTTSAETPPTGFTSQGATIDTLDLSVFGKANKDNVSAGATGSAAGILTHSGSAGWAAFVIRIPAAGGGGATCTPTMALMGVGSCG
jgi:hypothetical protein